MKRGKRATDATERHSKPAAAPLKKGSLLKANSTEIKKIQTRNTNLETTCYVRVYTQSS